MAAAPEKLQSPDRRDPGAQAFRGAEPRDRLHLVPVEPALPQDVEPDPRRERKPVAETCVRRVLDMRVGVDEPGQDHGVREPLALTEVGRRPDGRDAPVVTDRDGAVLDRRALDGHHPVRAEQPHSAERRAQ